MGKDATQLSIETRFQTNTTQVMEHTIGTPELLLSILEERSVTELKMPALVCESWYRWDSEVLGSKGSISVLNLLRKLPVLAGSIQISK
ncbi:hypothetical protein FRB97_003269, partial [Tulasnella sp. 331]